MKVERSLKMVLANGWKLACDQDNAGRQERWFANGLPAGAKDAAVPSYVHLYYPGYFGVAWYEKRFTPSLCVSGDELVMLRFDMADFLCEVYLNGSLVGTHRGNEDPFQFDVTEMLIPDGENLLSVRVSKPHAQPVDGYSFAQIPHRNQLPNTLMPGSCYNVFGLSGEVSLRVVPKMRISDLYVYGNTKTGCIDLELTVVNALSPCSCRLDVLCSEKASGDPVASSEYSFSFPLGETVCSLSVPVQNPRYWDIDDPFLYTVTAALVRSGRCIHTFARRCGFREFRVGKNGYFYLNGRRIFVRCSHTGNSFPIGQQLPVDPDLCRRDFVMAKASGFNMVRFIAGASLPVQLDFCDELGLMIYSEPYAAWGTENSTRAKELYLHDLLNLVKRDRSHPCVVIWGLLNETPDKTGLANCFYAAKTALPQLRALDPTRLCLFNSGRWDNDYLTGSFANPFSSEWETRWNDEGNPRGCDFDHRSEKDLAEAPPLLGDVHIYPRVPDRRQNERIRTLGSAARRPVFLSEHGVGSLFDTVWLCRRFEQLGADRALPDVAMVFQMNERFLSDLALYGFDREFAFPADIMRQSQRNQSRQRAAALNLVRSNPYINGYSMTGLLDHSICGEGLWTYFREWKPGIADVLQSGLAPLKWCLFLDSPRPYSCSPFTISGVLANEDILTEGRYPVSLRIAGEQGIVYEKELALNVARGDLRGLSVPVFCERVVLNVPSGDYVLRAELGGAAATCGELAFSIDDTSDLTGNGRPVYLCGASEALRAFLEKKRFYARDFAEYGGGAAVVALCAPGCGAQSVASGVAAAAEAGCRVVALAPDSLCGEDEALCGLPFHDAPSLSPRGYNPDWLYRKEYLLKRHPYFRGLKTGLVDIDDFGELLNGARFSGGRVPDETAAACFGTGLPCETGYDGGFNIGVYRFGKGAFVLNSFSILENVGVLPGADLLLVNMINTEYERLTKG